MLSLRRARALTASPQHTVLRTFTEPAPVEIVRAWGARELYDSLILANVARIAKYGRVSHTARPDDGLFEVVCCRSVPVQIDGEVLHLEAGSQVGVECVPHALTTVG